MIDWTIPWIITCTSFPNKMFIECKMLVEYATVLAVGRITPTNKQLLQEVMQVVNMTNINHTLETFLLNHQLLSVTVWLALQCAMSVWVYFFVLVFICKQSFQASLMVLCCGQWSLEILNSHSHSHINQQTTVLHLCDYTSMTVNWHGPIHMCHILVHGAAHSTHSHGGSESSSQWGRQPAGSILQEWATLFQPITGVPVL